MTFTVLITSVGGGLSAQTIAYLRNSRRHRVRVVGVDARADATGRHAADAFEIVPRGDEPGYVDRIAALAARHDVNLILPCSDEEALALAAARQELERSGLILACAPAATLVLLSDKNRAYGFLRERSLPVPDWIYVGEPDALDEAIERLAARGDFAVKPAHSRGNRDIFVISSEFTTARRSHSGREMHVDLVTFRREHIAYVRTRLPVLVAERLLPPAYDVDVLAWRGRALRIVPRRRHNAEGVPFLGNTIVDDEVIVELARRLAEATDLSWLYDFDLMTRRDGAPAILEINPRPSGSLAAAVAAGIPLLDDLISLAKGEALPPQAKIPAAATIYPYTALLAVSGGLQQQPDAATT